MAPRVLLGIVLAAAVALAARRARALSSGGALAATVVGAAAVAAGWDWAALVILFFVSSTALSRHGAERKAARTESVVAKGGERDAMQVLANGGPFTLAAALYALHPAPELAVLAGGALATAAADTWATEIGTLAGGEPRSIIHGGRVPAGMSGGVTLVGTLASILGAAAIAGAALLLGWPRAVAAAAAAGGLAGSLADSVLGATVQARRRCEACGVPTERGVHACGRPTRHDGGVRWLDNDWVNLLSGAMGALAALGVAAALR